MRRLRSADEGDAWRSVTAGSTAYAASKGPHPERVVFLMNEHTVVPDVALALQRVGDAAVVAEGTLMDPSALRRRSIPLPSGKAVLFRATELDAAIARDVALPVPTVAEGGAALARAVKLARDGWPSHRAAASTPSPEARWAPDATYPEETYPPLEHRLLALFRLWNVIRLFYPYLHLMDPGA